MSHGLLHDHLHEDDTGPLDEAIVGDAIWQVDHVELTTVGIDIGSATSHLMFSRLRLKRQGSDYSSRFKVVSREVLYRSPILLTPYEEEGLIDAAALDDFILGSYRAAGIDRGEIGAGAVILTGVALQRANARRIADLFAEEAGRFVCASAGHNMEGLLAAHGSGAVARSAGGQVVLGIDVGGGTTKLALCAGGQVLGTQAVIGGSRLVTFDAAGRVTRIEPWLNGLARAANVTVELGSPLAAGERAALADAIASRILSTAAGRPEREAVLAGELPATPRPDVVLFSGGVAEHIASPATGPAHGDLGVELGRALARRAGELPAPVEAADERIRATVTGASQFTMQVSGNTVHISGPVTLPVHNLPVVAIELPDDGGWTAGDVAGDLTRRIADLDLHDREEAIAIAIRWNGEPIYGQLRALADGVGRVHLAAARRDEPLVVVMEADVAASVGAILREELGITSGVVAVDGVELGDLDFIDLGDRILPANVVPIVVKSLIFPSGDGLLRPRIIGRAYGVS